MMDQFETIQIERLPTLYELLIQKTKIPVDLWTFYTYLSQYPYAINYLDFWIDLMAHTRLCKDYINLVRRSLLEESHLHHDENNNNNEDEDDNQSVTTSVLMNTLMEDGHLKFEDNNGGINVNSPRENKVSVLLEEWRRQSINDGELNISNQNLSHLMDEFLQQNSNRNSNQPYITTKQLLNNATHLVRTYIENDSKSERYLSNIPEMIRTTIINDVIRDKKYDPEIFNDLKDITYQFLEMDCFPKFLSCVALHNLHDEISDWRFHQISRRDKETQGEYNGGRTPFSNYTVLSRTLFGLVWIWVGMWIGYTLIFLNYNRAIRVVTLAPFLIGFYSIICGLYQVDIIYALLGVTQKIMYGDSPDTNTSNNKKQASDVPGILMLLGGRQRLVYIQHTFTRRLLLRRGLWCLCVVVLWTAVFTVIFSCVPGKRL